MTNTTALEILARRAVACKGWRWMPGMLVMSDPQSVPRPVQMTAPAASELRARVTSTVIGRWFGVFEYCVDHPDAENETASGDDLPGTLPDLSDPATIGCLLALVREAVEPERAPGDWPMVCTYQSAAKKWGVGAWLNDSGKATFAALVLPTYPTEAAALVAALEAA